MEKKHFLRLITFFVFINFLTLFMLFVLYCQSWRIKYLNFFHQLDVRYGITHLKNELYDFPYNLELFTPLIFQLLPPYLYQNWFLYPFQYLILISNSFRSLTVLMPISIVTIMFFKDNILKCLNFCLFSLKIIKASLRMYAHVRACMRKELFLWNYPLSITFNLLFEIL